MHTRPVTVPIVKPVKPIRIVTPVAIPTIKVKNNHPNSKKN
jgi:hypothetical protein